MTAQTRQRQARQPIPAPTTATQKAAKAQKAKRQSVPKTTAAAVEWLMSVPTRLGSAVIDPSAQLMTTQEAAALLRINRATVYVLMQRGELPSLKIGRARRISLADLQVYIQSCAG